MGVYMAFNSFPTNAVGGDASAATASGNLPFLTGTQLPQYWNNDKQNSLEGFAGSAGSAIEVPSGLASAMTLYDATGSTLWSYTSVDVVGVNHQWAGFWMNDAATLLYVVTFNVGTTPDTYHLSTIDLAGTIVNIGSDQPSVEFTNSGAGWSSNGMIQPDGSGGFMIIKGSSTVGQDEFAMMDGTGTFTTSPARITTANANHGIFGFIYKTDNGYWLYYTYMNGTNFNALVYISNGSSYSIAYLPFNNLNGAATSNGGGFMAWRDYVVGVHGGAQARESNKKFTKAQFNAFAQQLAIHAGVKL